MNSTLKTTLYLLLAAYAVGWVMVAPKIHEDLLRLDAGEPALEIIFYNSPGMLEQYLPYLKMKSKVVRLDHSFKKSRVEYTEWNTSIVIPVLPFLFFYYGEFSSGEIFRSGKQGFLYWYHDLHKIRESIWIS